MFFMIFHDFQVSGFSGFMMMMMMMVVVVVTMMMRLVVKEARCHCALTSSKRLLSSEVLNVMTGVCLSDDFNFLFKFFARICCFFDVSWLIWPLGSEILYTVYIEVCMYTLVIHTCMHACIHTYTHTHTHTSIHPSIHACMHAYMHTCRHADMQTCRHALHYIALHYITIHIARHITLHCITLHYITLPTYIFCLHTYLEHLCVLIYYLSTHIFRYNNNNTSINVLHTHIHVHHMCMNLNVRYWYVGNCVSL